MEDATLTTTSFAEIVGSRRWLVCIANAAYLEFYIHRLEEVDNVDNDELLSTGAESYEDAMEQAKEFPVEMATKGCSGRKRNGAMLWLMFL